MVRLKGTAVTGDKSRGAQGAVKCGRIRRSSVVGFLVKFERILGQMLSDFAHWWCWHHLSWWQAAYQYHRRCDRRSSEKRLVR